MGQYHPGDEAKTSYNHYIIIGLQSAFFLCRLTNKESFTLVICFYSMAGTLTIGGLVVTVRISHALGRRENEWSDQGWL